MDAPGGRDVSCEAQNDTVDVSGVLSASTYSLRDITNESLGDDDDAGLLDESVLALLDKPYSQLHDRLRLRKQEQYDGFDNSTGSSWIYPTNYPVRQYQFSITKAALFKNTLVVLPTGLGKTFIAAVVMYNIYRWYPTGKVIFMAPTRPLVNQQIEACYRIMGIPREDTAEITGQQRPKGRTEKWQTKRVFFATPQIVQVDLCAPEQAFPVEQVRLIVIDEAHKAKGRYAYTEVLRLIAARNKHFRVLALSATPGRTLEDVAEVIQNLLIAHIEVRWENSIDVSPYTFRKSIRTIVIPLGATIRAEREHLLQLVDPYVRRLLDASVLSCGNPASMSRGMIIMEQKRFRENSLLRRHPNHATVNADFGVCVSMYHALDLLVRHGTRALLNYFADGGDGAPEKYFVSKDRNIREFLERFRERYDARDETTTAPGAAGVLPDGAPAGPATGIDDIDFGHPKFRILEKQLVAHFSEQPDSKAIVFCEFRDSVAMIHRLLSERSPLIRPKCLVGQGGTSGIRAVTQKEQIAAMQQFRAGACNTLVATCVAEEGIDVGEVDLIVCFDITKNPTRFVQRIGRTGRQRVGRVLMLVTEGEEHQTLRKVLASKDRTNQQLAKSKDIMRILYRHSPRLVPGEFEPQCVEMYINIPSAGGDSDAGEQPGPAGGKRKPPKRDLEPAGTTTSKRRKINSTVTSASVTPPAKGTQDVRRFFQRHHSRPTDGELDANERDVFALQDSPAVERSTATRGPVPEPVVDRSIRVGETEQELAIRRRVQPLVRHYEQLRRDKFIHRQQLLSMPTVEQILQRRTLPIVRSELVRLVLRVRTDPVVTVEDPLDLPPLRPLPESYRASRNGGGDGSVWEPSCSPFEATPGPPSPPQMEASISNMFDSTLNMSDLAPDHGSPRPAGQDHGEQRPCQGKTPPVPPIGGGKRKATPFPVDSPLMRAFNRSIQKRLDSELAPVISTPAHRLDHGGTKRPRMGAVEPRVPGGPGGASADKRSAPIDSPLLRAFQRSVPKRTNPDGGEARRDEHTLRRRMVLEYFRLRSLEDVFADDSDDGSTPSASREQQEALASSGAAVGSDRVACDPPAVTDSDTELAATDTVFNANDFCLSDQPSRQQQPATGEPNKEPIVLTKSAAEDDHWPSMEWVSPRTTRRPVVPHPGQENRTARKKLNLGSASLVFDDSEDDLFALLDTDREAEKTVQLPASGLHRHRSPKPLAQHTPPKPEPGFGRSVLGESRAQDQPPATSPSVFAKLSRIVPRARPPPSKLQFSRLRVGAKDRQPSAGLAPSDGPGIGERPAVTCVANPSPRYAGRDTQIIPSPAGSPVRPDDPNESTIIAYRPRRDRACRLASDPESEGETGERGLGRANSSHGTTASSVGQEALSTDDENGDDFQTCQSGTSSTRAAHRIPAKPSGSFRPSQRARQKRERRHAANFFFDREAAASGSEDEDEDEDEDEREGWDEMGSFLDLDATGVDMRAIYLQSIRSPAVRHRTGRWTVRHPTERADHCSQTQAADEHDGDHSEEVDGYDDRSQAERDEREVLECSIITETVEVDSELSELEQAELVLKERRRAAKRKRTMDVSEPATTKRRRRVIVPSDSE